MQAKSKMLIKTLVKAIIGLMHTLTTTKTDLSETL